MPAGKSLRSREIGVKSPVKAPKKKQKSVPSRKNPPVDMENVNSNHSPQPNKALKRKKLEGGIPTKVGKRVNSNQDELEIESMAINKVTFKEEGEIIDMETTDGGQAAREFCSDDEAAIDTESEESQSSSDGESNEEDYQEAENASENEEAASQLNASMASSAVENHEEIEPPCPICQSKENLSLQ